MKLPRFEELAPDESGPASEGIELGRSRKGRPVIGYRFGNGPIKLSLIAGAHADEPVGPRLLRRLVRYLSRSSPESEVISSFDWWIVPHINPDGAARNRVWYDATDVDFDLASYLQNVKRELPGDDVEFAFPQADDDPGARPENIAVYRWWRRDPVPFSLHVSLHGMAFGGGPWFLIDPDWTTRCDIVKRRCREAVDRLGYELHDVERNGEKGFVRIEKGFSTRPNSKAMAQYFVERGDHAIAGRFRPSSMETIRSFGGDPLTLVSEVPLFILPEVGRRIVPEDTVANEWRERIERWRSDFKQMDSPDQVQRDISASGLRPVPLQDQMRLQWTMVRAGVEQVLAEETIQEAAVLIPVYRDGDGELRVVLVRRTEGGTHGGQIAFPGGKPVTEDDSMLETALRETKEEIGLGQRKIDVLTSLPVVDTVTSGFRIHPYIAKIVPPANWRLDQREIAEILDVKISDLLRPENHGEKMRRFPELPVPIRIAFFKIGERELWGATYRILRPLLRRITAGEWDV